MELADKAFVIETIFPLGEFDHDRLTKDKHRVEINNLPADTRPINCEIIYAGLEDNSKKERREHMLIKAFDYYMFLRVCAAYPDSGYAEFAYIRDIQPADSETGMELKRYAIDNINVLCGKNITVSLENPVDNELSM